MDQAFTIHLDENVVAALEKDAAAQGMSVPAIVSNLVARQYQIETNVTQPAKEPIPPRDVGVTASGTGMERRLEQLSLQESQQRLAALLGSVDLGHATGMDNDSIELDIARGYELQGE